MFLDSQVSGFFDYKDIRKESVNGSNKKLLLLFYLRAVKLKVTSATKVFFAIKEPLMFCIVEYVFTEAATGSVLYTKVFLKFSQNSQESTCARVFIKKETLAQTFSCEFGEIFKNTFFYRTPTVTVSKFKRLVFRIAIFQ